MFSLLTVGSYITQDANWERFLGINWHRILQLTDLREENTIATWFSSILFFCAAASFVLLGWGNDPQFQPLRLHRFIFQLAALATLVLSADEVGSVHETVGTWVDHSAHLLEGTPIYGLGFPWLLSSPFVTAFFAVIVYCVYQQTKVDSMSKRQSIAIRCLLWTAMITLPCVFVFEFIEAYLGYLRQKETFFPVVEEMLELSGMFSLLTANTLLARHFRL